MPKLQRFDQHTNEPRNSLYVFWCPGCRRTHSYVVYLDSDRGWKFNGDGENPTFAPSLLYPESTPRCHLFLRNGRLEFCGDCGHDLANQTVPLPDIPAEDVYEGAQQEW